jgi:DNA-binding XRE family transcriptional regulator
VSLGEHLKKRRMDLAITRKEAARRIGADQWTVINWEKGRTEPAVRFVPAITRFLDDLGKAPEWLRQCLEIRQTSPPPKRVGTTLLYKYTRNPAARAR